MCSENGISFQAIDESRVLLVSLLIGNDAFSEYRCDRNITLGITIPSLSKILRCGSNDDLLTIVSDDSPDTVVFVLEDKVKDQISEFSLKLLDIETEYLTVDDIEYSASITLPSTEWSRIVKNLSSLSESLQICVTKDHVKFSAEGEIGEGNIIVKPYTDFKEESNNVKIELQDPVDLTFGLKYLNDVVKATSLSSQVTIKLANGTPALFEYPLPSGYLRFFLAPKIGEDDE